jgi:hypothetical protein
MVVEHLALANDVSASITQTVLVWTGPVPTPSPVPSPAINTDGIINFIITKIVPILLAVIGIIFISRAGKGEMSRVLTSSAIVFIGIAFIAGGLTMFAFSRALVNLILGPNPGP